MANLLILGLGGFVSGILAGFLGIGGGTMLVPFMVALGYQPVQAIATSNIVIAITSLSGSIQNWRMGKLDLRRVLALGLPALVTAQLGVWLANQLDHHAPYLLLVAFGLMLLLNIYLMDLRKQLAQQAITPTFPPAIARMGTGSIAGIMAGLFGVGGGVIMVPLQLLLLGEPIKLAIQTSLGVVVMTAISALIGHALSQNILLLPGLVLGAGGLIGAQISTRLLPKVSDRTITRAFRSLLFLLAMYIFWKAWQVYSH